MIPETPVFGGCGNILSPLTATFQNPSTSPNQNSSGKGGNNGDFSSGGIWDAGTYAAGENYWIYVAWVASGYIRRWRKGSETFCDFECLYIWKA
jgi:hypothetical protein